MSTNRNTALDGVRGYAALSVALGHSVLAITGLALWSTSLKNFRIMPAPDILYRLLSLITPSDAAVMLFFVLSGHVLWTSFARKNLALTGVPDYLLSRILRLLPLVVVTTIIIGALKSAPLADIIQTALLLKTSVNGVLWSLQAEAVGSVFIAAAWLLSRGRLTPMLAILALSLAALPFARGSLIVFMPAFILGALIGQVSPKIWQSRTLFAAGLLVLVSTNVILGHGHVARLPEMAGAVAVVSCMGTRPLALLRTRISKFLGAVSYPFYLIHPAGMLLAAALLPALPPLPTLARIVIFAVLSIGAALPAAWALHHAVELPAMSLARRLRRPAVAEAT